MDQEPPTPRSRVLFNDDLLRIVSEYVGDCPLAFVLTCRRFRAIYNSLPETKEHGLVSSADQHCESASQVEWAISLGCPMRKLCYHAAGVGSLATLQWLRSQEPPYPWKRGSCYESRSDLPSRTQRSATREAAQAGHLHILRWLRSQGCPWDGRTCAAAAGSGDLHVLQVRDQLLLLLLLCTLHLQCSVMCVLIATPQ
jgi:hypothetical protein